MWNPKTLGAALAPFSAPFEEKCALPTPVCPNQKGDSHAWPQNDQGEKKFDYVERP